MRWVRYHNGKTPCTISMYAFQGVRNNKADYATAIVDKVLIECATHAEAERIHQIMLDMELQHVFVYNGESYDCFVFCITKFSEVTKMPLWMTTFKRKIERAGTTFEPKVNYDLDRHVIMANTWNLKTKRFAIPLVYEDILKGKEFVQDLASLQRERLRQPELDQLKTLNLEELE